MHFRNRAQRVLLLPMVLVVFVSASNQEIPAPAIAAKAKSEFVIVHYDLGDFYPCYLQFGVPTSFKVKEWMYPGLLVCFSSGGESRWRLGNLELNRGYKNDKWILRGEGIKALDNLLATSANENDVQSSVSKRRIPWGPRRTLEIIALRRSRDEANLRASLECFHDIGVAADRSPDVKTSCAISSVDLESL